MTNVLVTDYAWPSLDVERRVLGAADAALVVAGEGSEDELASLARDADAILTNWRPVTAAVLEAAERCVAVVRYGVGLDNIDVARATDLGMVVANVPDYCVEDVSDHTLALVLACARRVVRQSAATRTGQWDRTLGGAPARLRGQVLGLVGYGRLARAVAAKALAIGLTVVAHTPRLPSGPLGDGVIGEPDLDRLLGMADYVSLHVPATASTRGLVDERALRLMKPTAYLVNTARGSVVDEEALVDALERGAIAGAALDVLVEEPPPPDHPLLGRADVVVTPHAAFYSDAAIDDLQHGAAGLVVDCLEGRVPDTIVNPEVLDHDGLRL